MVFLFFLGTILVVGNGSSGSGSGVSEISEKMVPSRGSVGSGSVSFPPSLGSAAAAAAVVVTAEAPMPESTTVEVTTATGDFGRTATVDVNVGDLGRIGVEEKIGEPICVEVKEASDMELKIQFVSNTKMVAMRLTISPWATIRPRWPRCRWLHHSLREDRISFLGGISPVRGQFEGGLIRIITGIMHGRRGR